VGRLVEKKGFDDLLHACAQLASSGRRFRCDVYGEGPARADLETLRDRLGLAEVVRFRGARTQDEVLAAYHGADLFVLTPRVTADGDRDGVPNVLIEAMACGLPVVSTPVGGVPELVSHGADGFLVPARDPAALAACVGDLLDDDEARGSVGAAAAVSAARFDGAAAALRLAALFGSAACPA
jgi:glycosyltransferase involved in cell wall biosynthesis